MGERALDTTAPWYQGPNGATNFTRHEAQRFARDLLESKDYRDSVKTRVRLGTLPPAIEAMLWHYAYGKPIEQIAMTVTPGQEDLSNLSLEQLQERAAMIAHAVQEARELADALPAEVIKGPWPVENGQP